jgi:hypothetical protein
MSNYTDYNKIINTVNSITSDYTFIPDPDNNICIDTSNYRIGFNTVNPTQAIDVSGGNIKSNDIIFNNDLLYYDSSYSLDVSIKNKINQIITLLKDLSSNIDISLIGQ